MANKAICALTYGDTHVFTLPYGTCDTAAGTAAKTVAVQDGKFSLETGARVCVKFSNTNTASNPTLNVSGTGAKAIMYRGSAINKGYLAANRVYDFIYDGTDWELIGDINTNTTALGSMSGTLPVSKGGTGATAADGARTNLGITTEFLNGAHNHDNGSLNPNSIELKGASNHGGYIDFHYGGSSADYTSRIIESSSGVVSLNGSPILTEASTAFNDLKTSVSEGKSLVAAAVTNKGVNTAADAVFQTIANNINNIPTGAKVSIRTVDHTDSSETYITGFRPFCVVYITNYSGTSVADTCVSFTAKFEYGGYSKQISGGGLGPSHCKIYKDSNTNVRAKITFNNDGFTIKWGPASYTGSSGGTLIAIG